MHLGNNGFNHFILLMEEEVNDDEETKTMVYSLHQ
jgi:hypothetical protein